MADQAGSPECRDNRRRMHEGEATCGADVGGATCNRSPHARGPHVYDGGGTAKADSIGAAWEARHPAAPAPAVEGEPPTHGPGCLGCRIGLSPSPSPAGEPPEMTFAEACEALVSGKRVEKLVGGEWAEWGYGTGTTWASLSIQMVVQESNFKWRVKPPALTRVRQMAETFAATAAFRSELADFGERVLREFVTDWDLTKETIQERCERFLGPGKGR